MQYEKNRNRFKLCAICTERIISSHVVCENHLEEMELYRNELWFQELCRMQERQYEIDIEEYRLYTGKNYTPTLQKSYRTRGKQVPFSTKKQIFALYNNGVGDRRIAKQLNLPFYTVNKMLSRYRKQKKM